MKVPHIKISVRLYGRDRDALIERAQIMGNTATQAATELLAKRLERAKREEVRLASAVADTTPEIKAPDGGPA